MIKQNYTILAIDTSCDETSAAVTSDRKVLSNVIASQIDLHQEWGGVVPSIAKRAHQEKIDPVIQKALKKARKDWDQIDAIAVTQGPGLAIALEVGIAKAKELAQKYQKPLIAVNHMEGHLLSSFAQNSKGKGPFEKNQVKFPLIGLLVSGGHTQLVLMQDFGHYQLLGETLDDAAGEAYDKVAKMLKLGYPGGPIIADLAEKGNPDRFDLPIPMEKDPTLNFSFSGLKTACLYKLQELDQKGVKNYTQDFCVSFQRSVFAHLVDKLKKASKRYPVNQIVLGGGVIANLALRKEIRFLAKRYDIELFVPYSQDLCLDNAGMIGVAAFFKAQKGEFVKNLKKLDRNPVLNF